MPRPAPQPLLLQQALAERTRWLASRPHHSGELDGREIVDVMNTMKREWLASVDGVDKMKSADRKHAWQQHLHNTSPRCEKAIRLAIGHGVGDVDVLLEIVHTDSLQNTINPRVAPARCSAAQGRQAMRRQARRTETRGRHYLQSLARCTACGDDAPEGDLRACDHCSLAACKRCLPEERRNCRKCPETDRVLDDGEQYRSSFCNGCPNYFLLSKSKRGGIGCGAFLVEKWRPPIQRICSWENER